MSNFEIIEKNKVKITFEVDEKRLEEGIQHSYTKNRGKINIQGFRKGKAPRKVIEMNYGEGFFYEDAINYVLPSAYESAVKELELKVVSKPDIDVENLDKATGIKFVAEVFVKPEVSIENYKGLKYTKFDLTVSEEEITKEIDEARNKNSRIITVTDRPVAMGDIVTLDFEGFIDNVPFEGGKGEDYELTIGSHTFIDTFEDQLVGAKVGDDLEINVTFPAEYGKEDLQNKPAMFKVEIKEIKFKELPQLDDEFASEVSEFETLDEYKSSIKEKLEKDKEVQAENDKDNQLMKAVIENATMDIPSVMIENQIDQMVNNFGNQIRQQGLSMDMYLQYVGQTIESLREAYKENAETQVKIRLVLEAIGAKEDFEVTEEDITKELEAMGAQYNMEPEKLKAVMRPEDLEGMKEDLKVQKAHDLVVETSVEASAN